MTESFVRARRCDLCRLPSAICICAEIPRIELPFEIVVVQHYRERDSQSNTGRLVHRAITPSRLVVHGAPDVPPEPVWEPETDYRVLFPLGRGGSRALAPGDMTGGVTGEGERRRALVVLDGTWRQARRMSRRLPGIRAHPFVAMPEETPSTGPPLRRPRRAGELGTGEAVVRALEVLGERDAARALHRVLELLVSRVLVVRGRIPRNAAPAGLSEEQRRNLEAGLEEQGERDDSES